ncbi:MAG: hypothetical protein [crAssphage sp. isolate ctcc615]|uniref:Uncharacterized protein n=1 Tax=crAssphage sp. isolate ctcc615 TaxID=2989853 RepID=A0A345BNZ4_9CAUD|nr:MAG: hypothetical protein KNU00_gp78 [crAssphage sp. isolate ctcc615]AXF52165.1 MAG: hypothetical protein [crAssphage sp. isolate ctcc615]
MADIPTMSLKTAPIQYAAFTPTQYTAQTADPTLLARSLQLQEAREKEANQNMDIIDTALGEIRNRLNVAEHDWLSDKANNIRKKIDDQIALGNYQSAIRIAQQEARDLKRDEDLQNKVTVNRLYQQERQKVQSMNIDTLTKRRWDALNKYSYNGTADWKADWTPVADINLSNLQNLAAQMTAADAKSKSWQKSGSNEILIDENGKETTDLTKAVGIQQKTSTGRGGSNSFNMKTKEDMESTLRALLEDSNVNLSLAQKYDTTYWGYEDALTRSEDISLSETERRQAALDANRLKKQITDKNGIIIKDYDDWVNKKVITMFENMEYNHTTESTSESDGIDYSNALFARNKQAQNNNDSKIPEEDLATKGTQTQTMYENPVVTVVDDTKNNTTYDATSYGFLFIR